MGHRTSGVRVLAGEFSLIDELGGYTATMKISDELDPEYLDELCDESFKKFYFRKEWLAREVLERQIVGMLRCLPRCCWLFQCEVDASDPHKKRY